LHSYPRTAIWRHRKENLKKCTLTGLEKRHDLCFFRYPTQMPLSISGYVVLVPDGSLLNAIEDQNRGLLLIDATWRYAEKMRRQLLVEQNLVYRRLPSFLRTAYPRCQKGWVDPQRGLASIEALYAAYWILGYPLRGLFNHYYWSQQFLSANPFLRT